MHNIAGGDWTTEGTAISQSIGGGTSGGTGGGTAGATSVPGGGDQDWNIGPTTTTKDWADEAGEWAGTEPQVCFVCVCVLASHY